MALTPEQIQAFREKYKLTPVGQTSSSPQEVSQASSLGNRVGTALQKRGDTVNKTFESDKSFAGKTLNLVGQSAGFVNDVIGETAKSAMQVLPESVKETTKGVGIAVLQTPLGQAGVNAIKSGADAYNKFKSENPDVAQGLEDVLNIASLLPVGKGAEIIGKGAGKVLDVGIDATKVTAGTVVRGVKGVNSGVKGAIDSTINPEKIMQRVARIPKGAQAKFEKTAGESVGSYLTKRDIYGNTEQITTKLYDRFTSSRREADKALASLPGTYKPIPLKTALTELLSREKRVSSPGSLSPDFKRTRELVNKFNKEGLDMSEINEAKRLFERNVRLDFVKQNLPEGMARSTNIDSALREWQFNQAEKLGLKNLGEINKETRLAKQLMDDLGREYAGSAGNNSLSLTDTIALASGDPRVIAGFFAKKALSSQKLQSAIAKKLYKGEKMGASKAKLGTPKPGLEEFMKR